MENTSMKVSEIIEIYERARQDRRIPAKPKKPRRADDFKLIFNEKCEEIKDDRQ